MLASETLSYEQVFLQFEQNRGRVSVLQVSHPDGQPFHLNVYSPGHHSFYYAERFSKERIVLHFTAGFLQGDVPWLTRANKYVSVPFVVGRSGEIFNLYRSAYWSYHLGVGDRRWDRASIGIELSNIGPLVLEGNMLKYEVQRQLPDGRLVTVRYDYCDVNESAYYQRIPQRYRGHEFFAAFTDAQYNSLARLLVYLTNRYNIPRVFLPPATRFDALPQNFSHRGILSHVNYRPSGKWDIGPAFDWARLEAAVNQQVILEP